VRRDHRLTEMGFRVLRFWLTDVDENIEGVIENNSLGDRTHQPRALTVRLA
jgi:very-short-patch-repair endonuclease